MSNKALSRVVWVFVVLVLAHIGLDVYLFYLERIEFDLTIPIALGIQVSLASLIFVVASLTLVFFGISRLGDIEDKAIREASRVAKRTVQDLAQREAKIQSAGHVPDSDEGEPLDGEEEGDVS